MKPSGLRQVASSHSNWILICLYVLEFSPLLTTMAIYRKGERPMLVFLAGPAGLVFIVTVLAVVTFNIVIMYLYRKHRARQTQRFLSTLILNLRTIVPAVATAEMFHPRIYSEHTGGADVRKYTFGSAEL
jgi:hypothetical protein